MFQVQRVLSVKRKKVLFLCLLDRRILRPTHIKQNGVQKMREITIPREILKEHLKRLISNTERTESDEWIIAAYKDLIEEGVTLTIFEAEEGEF